MGSRKRAQRSVAATNEDQATAHRRELAGSAVASLWRNEPFRGNSCPFVVRKSSRKNKIPSYSSAKSAKKTDRWAAASVKTLEGEDFDEVRRAAWPVKR
jgi:hypothetical protein